MENNTREMVISCLCGQHQHTYALPTSVKTLDYGICHCNSCRKSSGGSLYQGSIVWKLPLMRVSETDQTPKEPQTLLQHYAFGPILHYWFCGTCSTKVYWQYLSHAPELELFPGLVPDTLVGEGQLSLSCNLQTYLVDTLDEGLSSCFFGPDGETGLRYQEDTTSEMYEAQEKQEISSTQLVTVEGECHCGQITLKLSSHSGTRFPVELDTSAESRQLNSVNISVWALVERDSIVSINNMPLHIFEALMSKPRPETTGPFGVYKTDRTIIYFCNKCSASVLTQPLDSNLTSILKVGAGLLKSQRGAREEDILDWSNAKPIVLEHYNIRLDPKKF